MHRLVLWLTMLFCKKKRLAVPWHMRQPNVCRDHSGVGGGGWGAAAPQPKVLVKIRAIC